jgi:hypothetical protein
MNTSRALSPGDLATGMHVTVIDNQPDDEPSGFADSVMVFGASPAARDWRGVAFEVKVVDLPFVLAALPNNAGKVCLDTRRHRLMELKPEFWQALHTADSHSDFDRLVAAHNALAEKVGLLQNYVTNPPAVAPAPTPRRTLRLAHWPWFASAIGLLLIIYAATHA